MVNAHGEQHNLAALHQVFPSARGVNDIFGDVSCDIQPCADSAVRDSHKKI